MNMLLTEADVDYNRPEDDDAGLIRGVRRCLGELGRQVHRVRRGFACVDPVLAEDIGGDPLQLADIGGPIPRHLRDDDRIEVRLHFGEH